MKTIVTIPLIFIILFTFNSCNNSDISTFDKDTLIANYSGITEIYTGLDHITKFDSLTSECYQGIKYLNIDTIIFSKDTLRWSCTDYESESFGYLLYKVRLSNDTLYGNFIGYESKGLIIKDKIQDNIVFINGEDGLTIPFYYLKKSYHLQFFSFLPIEPLKKDYINTLELDIDSLKYWKININFKK